MAKLTDAQKRAVNKYQKENLEIVSFRVKKGKRRAYNELAKIKELPLSNIMESFLDSECKAAGIIPDDYIIKGGEKDNDSK